MKRLWFQSVSMITALGLEACVFLASAQLAAAQDGEWSAADFAPPARGEQVSALDPARNRLIVFGGASPTEVLSDLWALDLQGTPRWIPLAVAGASPGARSGASMVYHPLGDRMILFGGLTPVSDTTSEYRNDLWELSLGTPEWRRLEPTGTPPSPRSVAL